MRKVPRENFPSPGSPQMQAEYNSFVLENWAVTLRREAGDTPPWTNSASLHGRRFCRPLRREDRETKSLMEHVRACAPQQALFLILAFRKGLPCWRYFGKLLPVLQQDSFSADAFLEYWFGPDFSEMRATFKAYPATAYRITFEEHCCKVVAFAKWMAALAASTVELLAALRKSTSSRATFDLLHQVPGLGVFLAYQCCIDVAGIGLKFYEASFVAAGSGCIWGLYFYFQARACPILMQRLAWHGISHSVKYSVRTSTSCMDEYMEGGMLSEPRSHLSKKSPSSGHGTGFPFLIAACPLMPGPSLC